MTENYKIIQDEQKLRDFIDWLPNLEQNEVFFGCLLSRKKYDPTSKVKSETQLKRFICKKDHLFNALRQLECPIGSYTSNGEPVAQITLACYFQVNPRDMELSSKHALVRIAELITKPYNGYNVRSEVESCIQTTPSKNKSYIHFDFDAPIEDILPKIKEFINEDCLTVVKTRGGFHLLIETKKIDQEKYRKTWYQNIISLGVDASKDILLPMVGCVQSDFVPFIYKG